MPTHGRARETTIKALRNCENFKRSGFGMWATEGAVVSTGRLPSDFASMYAHSARVGNIAYTVVSYGTPIAWLLKDGSVIIPDTKYSVTTTSHQNLCKVYLRQ